MKQIFIIFFFTVIIISCKNEKHHNGSQIFKIDANAEKNARSAVLSNNGDRRDTLYGFATHVKAEFFSNDTLDHKIDTMCQDLESYYYWEHDTLFLLAHLGGWSTNALYARISGDSVSVKYLKAPHENTNLYRLQLTDSSTEGVEVPCIDYELIISKMPDSISKQTVFGHFSFKSASFYRWYNGQYSESDWAYYHQKLRTNMAFYFRANYKKPWWK